MRLRLCEAHLEIVSPALHIGRTKKKKRSASPVTGRSAKIWGHMDSPSALSGDTQDWSPPSTGNLYQQSSPPPFHSPREPLSFGAQEEGLSFLPSERGEDGG